MTSAEIEAFISDFEDCSLPGGAWTHGKHLVVALWYLLHFPREEASRRIREGIQRYNLSRGKTDGYHETITLAWIAVISDFLARQGRERPVADLAQELLATCGQKEYLLRFYSRDRLFADEARRQWVEPDLRRFDDVPERTEAAD
jgi:hypothetical protein